MENNNQLKPETKTKLLREIKDATTTSEIATAIRKIDEAATNEDVVGILKKTSTEHAQIVDSVLSTGGSGSSS